MSRTRYRIFQTEYCCFLTCTIVDDPPQWRYSSARNDAGLPGGLGR
jgi:hypothetical protein